MSEDVIPHLRFKFTWFLGILAAFVVFVVIGEYSARMARVGTTYDEQRAVARITIRDKVRTSEAKLLTTVAWVDQDKNLITLPIDEAMAKEIDTLKAKPLGAGSPLTPPPAPAPAAAPAAPAADKTPATNAAPATPSPAPTTK
jgi:hypothetical protein